MRRVCDSCGTPLPGRKSHGYPMKGGAVCGRASVQKTFRTEQGLGLRVVSTPGCRP